MKNIIIIFVISVLFVGCENEPKYAFEKSNLGLLNAFTSGNNDGTDDMDVDYFVEGTPIKEKSTISRKLIKNGKIIFETENLASTKNQITSLIKKHKGYISSDSQNEYNNRINNHLTIRIPAKKFDTILSGISKNVKEFDTREIKIYDVTEEFLDVQARLKNKKELEKRYLIILQKAKSVKEILDVEKEIGQLREDIESAEGKLNYLKNQVLYSTLEVSFYKTVSNETSFGRKFKKGFKNGFENLKLFFIGLINIWPFIILIILIIFFFRRWRRNKKKQ